MTAGAGGRASGLSVGGAGQMMGNRGKAQQDRRLESRGDQGHDHHIDRLGAAKQAAPRRRKGAGQPRERLNRKEQRRDKGEPEYFLPYPGNIQTCHMAVHEYLGLAWAFVRGQVTFDVP